MSAEAKARAAQEMAYCEAVLAKSASNILLKTLPSEGLVTWKHYPEKDVYDPQSGAQWYYHCHNDADQHGEHGHFHCFVRPNGRESDPCHLIAVGADSRGKLKRLFTVNQWVVGGKWYDAETTNACLEHFNVELADPDFLVNRWLTAVVTRYEDEIINLNIERDEQLLSSGRSLDDIRQDRSLEVITQLSF
ncbi:DUF6969 family protein [Brucellaceae bacterium D45D]